MADLGLKLNPNNRKRSTRVCRGCSRTVDQMERYFSLLRDWEELEREDETISDETSTPASSELNSDKMASAGLSADERDPSPLPEPPKKRLRQSLPTENERRSVTKVITTYPSGRSDAKVASNREAGIIYNVATKNWRTAANLLYSHKELFDEIKWNILIAINKQCRKLANPKNGFYLYKTSPNDLKSFSFDKLTVDLERMAPFLLAIFNTISKNNPDAACASLCIALRGRLSTMSAFAYHINNIIARGGLKRERAVFNKLSGMAITTSHSHVRLKRKEMKMKKTSGAAGLDTQQKVELSSELSKNPEAEMNSFADTEDQRTDGADMESLSASVTNQELPT